MSLFDREFDDLLHRKRQGSDDFDEQDLEMEDDLFFAMEKGLEEIKSLHKYFTVFTKKVNNLVISKHLMPFIYELAKACENLSDLISGDVDMRELKDIYGDSGVETYHVLRAELLSDIWNNYKEEVPGDDIPF